MHVAADLNWFLQFIVLTFAGAFGLLYLVRNTASRYFVVDSSFDSSAADYSSLDSRKRENMGEVGGGAAGGLDSCAVCGLLTKKQCARCKMVKYCSEACQKSHWSSGHKTKCKDLQSFYKSLHTPKSALRERKALGIAVGGSSKIIKQSNKILFPYEEFLEFFSWDKPGYPPCGLLNCGNSCFANVVLQCLAYTRPLVAYVLEKGHRRECQRDDWCFMCEFQTHVERASRSLHPFSPMNILSRLPNIGGNLGYGKQEDAHEFMRFAIDMMQSVCLDEFGGEKAVHPSYQETTLIQHIFGGRLRSQVICAECNNVSNQFENLMDLTVEIHGDAGSLEECLDQFTAKEWLHGDNMYKCDGCNAYVMAWKRLTVQRAPNILTIALKRFQSGRFGKLNKRVTFPETLDLNPYMSELEDGNDIYKLYAVIVHVDMLNASFFGHYICYVKDFGGKWHKIDDCKVASVGLDEVLSQGAYMLLYNRICARPSCLIPTELLEKEKSENVKINEVDPLLKEPDADVTCTHPLDYGLSLSANCPEDARGDAKMVSSDLPIIEDVELHNSEGLPVAAKEVASPVKHDTQPKATNTSSIDTNSTEADAPSSQSPSTSDVENACHESKTDINLGLLRSLCEESADTKNCRFKESSITCDVSAMDITTDEVKDTSMPENVGCGNALPFSDDIQNAAKKLNGESSVNFANSTSMPENVGCGNAVPLSDDIQNAARKLNGECSANSANSTSMSEKVGNGNAGPSSNGVQNAAAKRSNGESSANSANSTSMPENVGHGNAGPSSDDIENSAKRTNGESSPNSANSTSMPENVGYGAGPPSDDIQSAVKKSNGESSAAKFKPIFAPGFLGKHPRKSSIKPEDKASTKVIQLTPESHPNNHTREAEKSSPSSENGGGLIKQKRLHIVHENRKADISKVHANGNSVV